MITKDKLGQVVSVGDTIATAVRPVLNWNEPELVVVKVQAISPEGMVVFEEPRFQDEIWVDSDRVVVLCEGLCSD